MQVKVMGSCLRSNRLRFDDDRAVTRGGPRRAGHYDAARRIARVTAGLEARRSSSGLDHGSGDRATALEIKGVQRLRGTELVVEALEVRCKASTGLIGVVVAAGGSDGGWEVQGGGAQDLNSCRRWWPSGVVAAEGRGLVDVGFWARRRGWWQRGGRSTELMTTTRRSGGGGGSVVGSRSALGGGAGSRGCRCGCSVVVVGRGEIGGWRRRQIRRVKEENEEEVLAGLATGRRRRRRLVMGAARGLGRRMR